MQGDGKEKVHVLWGLQKRKKNYYGYDSLPRKSTGKVLYQTD